MKGVKRSAIRKDLIGFFLPWISTMVLALAVALWEFAWVREPEIALSPSFLVGVALIAFGLATSLVSVITLRRSYSSFLVIKEEHRLVRHGVYRHLRHPVYSGTCLAMFGMPLCLSSFLGLAIMLLLVPIFVSRIEREEALLIEEFGAEYESYRETTRKLIPFVF